MANKSESINNKKEYTVGVDLAKGKDLTVKVNVDVSDALKGLKAVQREAKKAVRLLKETGLSDDEKIVRHSLYECLSCRYKSKLEGKKKDYSKVYVCPKCREGAFVDIYFVAQYK